MPIDTSEDAELFEKFDTALLAQKQALTNLIVMLNNGAPLDNAKVAELIKFHNDRVSELYDALQPYRSGKV